MIIERRLFPELREHLGRRQITVITGMRRTGKTTLLEQLMAEVRSENKAYFDLERVDNRELFSEKNYDNILATLSQKDLDFSKKAYIFLDEIQFMPGIASVLKYLYDHNNIKFIVSGSSSYYLKGLFSESLAGRKKLFELHPLDFGEFLRFKGVQFKESDFRGKKFSAYEYARLKKYYEEYVKYGAFPEVALTTNPSEKRDLASDILSSYINIDVKSLADLEDSRDIENLMRMIAGRMGSKLDYSKISRLTGIKRPKVVSYMEFLEKTYLISTLPVTARHPDREIIKASKVYMCDNGIAQVLFEDIGSGALFENALFNQLRNHGRLAYYSLKTGKEIDFILGGLALEAKESPTSMDIRALKSLSEKAGTKSFRLVGRKEVPGFDDYIWGGDIR
jgi:uncharacterized protein